MMVMGKYNDNYTYEHEGHGEIGIAPCPHGEMDRNIYRHTPVKKYNDSKRRRVTR